MSTLIHCDGPSCDRTAPNSRPPSTFGVIDWLTVEASNGSTWHFHSRACLAEWAAPVLVPPPSEEARS